MSFDSKVHFSKQLLSKTGSDQSLFLLKKDPLDKQNYRPVSILPTISKLYERTIHDQLTEFFDNIFSPFLAAFRKGFGCQTTLLRLIEDWKTSLDQHKSVAAILKNLSKAFDCLPHDLLLAKLEAYGLTGGGGCRTSR